ncbi:hypothetical protein HZC53_04260 [Candidatus Uhrbacteria bacterium]|nr:hypothetical protein [Candidatus Uhrbacteria bacterium]
MGEMKMPKIETGHVDEMMTGDFEAKVQELREHNERSMERLEETEALWIADLEQLEAKIPHDDVLVDDRTLSFDVLRNAWRAKLMELETLREELEQAREQLDFVTAEQAD